MRKNPEVEFRVALSKVDPKCTGREDLYVDYRTPPTRKEAKDLCADCPLLDLCRAATERNRPAWGVWGGRVFGAKQKKPDSA